MFRRFCFTQSSARRARPKLSARRRPIVQQLESRRLMTGDVPLPMSPPSDLESGQVALVSDAITQAVAETALANDPLGAVAQSLEAAAVDQLLLSDAALDDLFDSFADMDLSPLTGSPSPTAPWQEALDSLLDQLVSGDSDSSDAAVASDAIVIQSEDGGLVAIELVADAQLGFQQVIDNIVPLPELGAWLGFFDTGEVQIEYHLPGETDTQVIQIDYASGQSLIDKLKELDGQGAIIDHLTILGHGGNKPATRGTSIALCEDQFFQVQRIGKQMPNGEIKQTDCIVVTGTEAGTVDITDLMKRTADRSPEMIITLKACYAGEDDSKLGKELSDILGRTVEAYTSALKFIPYWNVTVGWLGSGKWVTFTPATE
jgi:hypothetical protein